MQEKTDFPLPGNLPRPVDDGAAVHLKNARVPAISLESTAGRSLDLFRLGAPRTIIYCYPMTCVPGKTLPEGWDLIPGARGCTPQTCGFRDQHREFSLLPAEVFGLSTQTSAYQREMAQRLGLPFEVLSDCDFQFCDALRLPTFEVNGTRLLKRLTLIIRGGQIEHVIYPVFPPNESAAQILRWCRENPIVK